MLRAFHARYAGGASEAFAPGDAGDGRNSYEHLLDGLTLADPGGEGPPRLRVLDAGCGDGFLLERLASRRPDLDLVGVDMSPEELACARQRLPSNGSLIEATLDAVPLPDGSIDAVLSHMVLMLITDIDPVLAELRRLLRPGGELVAVVGRRAEFPPAQRRVMEALWSRLDAECGPPPSVGDPRFREEAGLRDVFDGWGDLRCTDLSVAIPVPLDHAVRFLQRIWYGLDRMSPATWTEIDRWLHDERDDLAPDGVFTWTMAARRFVVGR